MTSGTMPVSMDLFIKVLIGFTIQYSTALSNLEFILPEPVFTFHGFENLQNFIRISWCQQYCVDVRMTIQFKIMIWSIYWWWYIVRIFGSNISNKATTLLSYFLGISCLFIVYFECLWYGRCVVSFTNYLINDLECLLNIIIHMWALEKAVHNTRILQFSSVHCTCRCYCIWYIFYIQYRQISHII